MFKNRWVVFIAGLLLGAGGVGLYHVGKAFKEGFASWGAAQVYFDTEAREHIGDKIKPSAAAKDVFFHVHGFQDPVYFIAYTDTPEHLDQVVKKLTGKAVAELDVWADQLKHHSFTDSSGKVIEHPNYHREPGAYDKKQLTSLYDVDVIRKGRIFIKDETTHGWHIIVDEETGRFYYHSWDT